MAMSDISFGPSSITVQWKIKGFFSLVPDQDCFFQSDQFHFLAAVWQLKAHASRMVGTRSSDWLQLWLYRVHIEIRRAHRVRCRMWIKRQDGTDIGNWNGVWEFGVNSSYWSPPRLEGRAQTLRGEKDALTVICHISTLDDAAGAERGTQTEGEKEYMGCLKKQKARNEALNAEGLVSDATGVDKLVQNFKDLLSTGEKSDLVLKVRDQDFKCHEAILAVRAPAFVAKLKHSKDEANYAVQVEDCDPTAFGLFLEYLYTGAVEILSTDTVFSLYRIAEQYDATDLKSMCLDFIADNISEQTFCEALSLSLQYVESHLLEKITVFFSKNMREILATTKWQDFLKENTAEGNMLLMKALDLNESTISNSG